MSKYKFVAEFEIKASPKAIFPFLSTSSGLTQWFCEAATFQDAQNATLTWDNEAHPARVLSLRMNKSIKFEFIPKNLEEKDRNYLEFRLETSELTNSNYLKVTDYSENHDEEELNALWDEFIHNLKSLLGSF